MEGKGVYVVPPPRQKRSRDILISVDLRTVSRNIIQILNWKRYLAIVNACGSFHRGAPRVKPAPATESYSRDAPPTRETRPRNFFSLSSPSPLPSSNRVKSIELSIYHTFLRLDSPFHRRFFWKSPSRFFLPYDLSRFFFSMAIFLSIRWSSRFFFFMKFFSDLRSSDFVFWIIFSSNEGDFYDDIDNY